MLGLWGVAILAVVYPLAADSTQQPLAIFVIPLLITATLGSWRQTAIVGLVVCTVSLVEGLLQDELDGAGLAARMMIIVVTTCAGTVGAFERERRQRVIEESQSRRLVLDMLQDSLVPAPVPPPTVVVSVRYVPGDERLLLGGDFFEAIALPTGALGYIIGDVCGQGPRAAAFGAAVRSGWKALATVCPDEPLRWVHGLEDTFFRLGRHDDSYVTLNTGLVQLDVRHWRFVCAGHPWPIMITDDAVTMVAPRVGPPLGVGIRSGWDESHQALPQDATMLLYTDGLTENAAPGARRDHDGERRLLDYLDLTRTSFDIDSLLAEFGPHGFHDDVAVMAVAAASIP
jgi:hypothetical protein